MEFTFKSDVTTWDLWKLSMCHIYRSLAGVCNIVFTAASVLVTVKLWRTAADWQMAALILGCLLFPVIQPLVVYRRAARQVAGLPEDMGYRIDDSCLRITAGGQCFDIPWSLIRSVVREPGALVLTASAGRGYMLTDRVLGSRKEEFCSFVENKLADQNKGRM